MTLDDFAGWPHGPIHLGIGVFDGVHLGHESLVAEVARRARGSGGRALATTFDPLPVEVFAPASPPARLSDLDERVTLLGRAGADDIVVLHFTHEMATWPPDEFARRLARAGELREVVVGEDFRFGHERAGDVAMLAALGERLGFSVRIAAPVMRDGRVVSSTRIRNALLAGDVAGAASLLGRAYGVNGSLERGEIHGAALGFPALRVTVPPRRLLPRDGIYAARAVLGTATVAATVSLGAGTGGQSRLETYLIDTAAEPAADAIRIEFVAWIREQQRFADAGELAARIADDIARTRDALR